MAQNDGNIVEWHLITVVKSFITFVTGVNLIKNVQKIIFIAKYAHAIEQHLSCHRCLINTVLEEKEWNTFKYRLELWPPDVSK